MMRNGRSLCPLYTDFVCTHAHTQMHGCSCVESKSELHTQVSQIFLLCGSLLLGLRSKIMLAKIGGIEYLSHLG